MDGDTVIIFLTGNGVLYEMPTEDDWYRANRVFSTITGPGLPTKQIWIPEEAASPMGCVQQYQICTANEESCGSPAGFFDAAAQVFEEKGFNKSEAIAATHNALGKVDDPTVSRLQWLVALCQPRVDIGTVFVASGTQALASSTSFITHGLEGFLPADQWRTDMIHAWATAFAFLQAQFVEIAHGTTNPDLVKYRIEPADTSQVNLCTNQVYTHPSIRIASLNRLANIKSENSQYCIRVFQFFRPSFHICSWPSDRWSVIRTRASARCTTQTDEISKLRKPGVDHKRHTADTPTSP